MAEHRIYRTSVASVYPHYVSKAEKKGRTKKEVDEILCWLTGYGASELGAQLEQVTDFKRFFAEAPALNPSRKLITGVVCGVRVEEIEDPLMQEIRYLDKLVDELAEASRWRRSSARPDPASGASGIAARPRAPLSVGYRLWWPVVQLERRCRIFSESTLALPPSANSSIPSLSAPGKTWSVMTRRPPFGEHLDRGPVDEDAQVDLPVAGGQRGSLDAGEVAAEVHAPDRVRST